MYLVMMITILYFLFLGLESATRYMYDMIVLLLRVDMKYMILSIINIKIKVIYNLLIH